MNTQIRSLRRRTEPLTTTTNNKRDHPHIHPKSKTPSSTYRSGTVGIGTRIFGSTHCGVKGVQSFCALSQTCLISLQYLNDSTCPLYFSQVVGGAADKMKPEKLLERGRRPGTFGVKFGRGIGGESFGGGVVKLAATIFSKQDIGRTEREYLDILNLELKVTEDDILSHHQGLTAAAHLPPTSRHSPRSVAMRLSHHSHAPVPKHTYVERPHAHQRHRRRRSPPQDVPELQPILRLRRQQRDFHLAHRHQILWLSLPYHLTQHRNRHCRLAVFPCIRRLMVPLHLPHKLFIVALHHHLVKQSLTYFEERCQFRYHVRGSQGLSAP